MSKTAADKDRALAVKLSQRTDRLVTPSQANILRRAERTLSRWGELLCGDGRHYVSRDEKTGKCRMHWYGGGPRESWPVADRETGALRRVAELCGQLGLHFFHQTDPRGCMLYVAAEPLTEQTYHRGVACCDD